MRGHGLHFERFCAVHPAIAKAPPKLPSKHCTPEKAVVGWIGWVNSKEERMQSRRLMQCFERLRCRHQDQIDYEKILAR